MRFPNIFGLSRSRIMFNNALCLITGNKRIMFNNGKQEKFGNVIRKFGG